MTVGVEKYGLKGNDSANILVGVEICRDFNFPRFSRYWPGLLDILLKTRRSGPLTKLNTFILSETTSNFILKLIIVILWKVLARPQLM
jgi:hypothetical protein